MYQDILDDITAGPDSMIGPCIDSRGGLLSRMKIAGAFLGGREALSELDEANRIGMDSLGRVEYDDCGRQLMVLP